MKKNEQEKLLQNVFIGVMKRKAKFFFSCRVGHAPMETPNYLLT